MATATVTSHVVLDDQGRAWVAAANVKVIEIVLDHLAYGWSADAIHENHPGLTLAQIHSALAWYYDHQAEMDAEIESQEMRLRELRTAAAPSSLRRRALSGVR